MDAIESQAVAGKATPASIVTEPPTSLDLKSLALSPAAVERIRFDDAWTIDGPEIVAWTLRRPEVRIVGGPVKDPTIRVVGFAFPESPGFRSSFAAKLAVGPAAAEPSKRVDAARALEESETEARKPKKRTRLKPPRDCVKLEDRLYYLLQPSLEQIVQTQELELPFEPFNYQLEGIGFLYPRREAILADEMGLGKTMQAISTIRLLLNAGELRSVLLICPKPLVSNWKREFALWAPEIPISVIEGDQARRNFQWDQASPVKIANYEILPRDVPPRLEEEALKFDLVVLDEAQRIKNRGNATSKLVCSIPAGRRWALTGTPVENSPDDLLGIFEYLAPGYLRQGLSPREIGAQVSDFVMRRTKEMVMTDMPPKLFRDETLALAPEQQATYDMAESEGVIHLNEIGDKLTVQHVFELVLRLKQICNFDPLTSASCKLERLVADMEEVHASGQKAIVFSQWVQTLTKLRPHLDRFGAVEYHGRVPSAKRDGVIQRFKEDPSTSVILMSYGAGAVGLNLQFCRYVFLFDRWWNPAIEDQAINRAHRIGAAGSVTVTRMNALGTIEERIHDVLEEKRALFATIFESDDPSAKSMLSADDLFGLFNLRTPKGPLRQAA
jgi:SNF2 family DNA or RNA helicase